MMMEVLDKGLAILDRHHDDDNNDNKTDADDNSSNHNANVINNNNNNNSYSYEHDVTLLQVHMCNVIVQPVGDSSLSYCRWQKRRETVTQMQ